MDTNLRIRPLTFDDWDVILSRRNGITLVAKAIYQWQLRENPYRRDDFPIGFVLEHKIGIVGFVLLVPANFKIGRRSLYSCFETELMVIPMYRFHGLKLINKVWNTDLFPLIISTSPNRASFEIERRMGAVGITFTSCRYIKVTNIVDTIVRIGKKLKIPYLIKRQYSFFKSLMTKTSKNRDFTVEEVRRFDERFTRFYEDLNYDIMHIRDKSFLNWRYIDFPFGERKIYCLTDHGKKLRGFVVIQLEKRRDNTGIRIANILDLMTRKDDTTAMNALLSLVTDFAKEKKLHCIEIIPPSTAVKNILEKHGFFKEKLIFPEYSYKFNILHPSVISRVISNIDNWYISFGDGHTPTFHALSWREEHIRSRKR